MMEKKFYTTPRCSLTRVVLEQGLCATSGDTINDVEVKTGTDPVKVTDYSSIGDKDGFNDITFE